MRSSERIRHLPTKGNESMFAARDADQQTTGVKAGTRRPGGRSVPQRAGCRPLDHRQTAAGRSCAEERFVRETEPMRDFLMLRATRLTNQRFDAEDLVQETLLKAYVSFDNFREGTSLNSWLARIMVNTWVDRYRAMQRRPAEQLSAEFLDFDLAASASHSSGGLESAETRALQSTPGEAEEALRALPEDLRLTVYYACVAGYRNTEIAELLNVPVGTVGSRLHRGKSLLRAALADLEEGA
jgi:RNA polymerase sigma-70 factor (ECF subfamily)